MGTRWIRLSTMLTESLLSSDMFFKTFIWGWLELASQLAYINLHHVHVHELDCSFIWSLIKLIWLRVQLLSCSCKNAHVQAFSRTSTAHVSHKCNCFKASWFLHSYAFSIGIRTDDHLTSIYCISQAPVLGHLIRRTYLAVTSYPLDEKIGCF